MAACRVPAAVSVVSARLPHAPPCAPCAAAACAPSRARGVRSCRASAAAAASQTVVCHTGAARRGAAWRRHAHVRVVVAAAGGSGATEEIPIFPLGLCAHPTGEVPLMIFEARYRVLFNTLLAGAQGLETELIDEDSPFKGTRAFGMCLAVGNGIASIGTMLHIQQHSRRPEGRMEVLSRGGRRFRIVRVVKELPVLLCEVEWLEDTADVMGEDDVFTLPELADELRVLYQTTLSLSNKVNRGESGIDELPAPELSPEELSFWLMRVFQQYPTKQQALLELTSTRERLTCCQDVLRETQSYLSATSALKSALADIGDKKQDDGPPASP